MSSSIATTSHVNTQKDDIYKTVTITIINATIFDDRCSTLDCSGSILFSIFLENNTYKDNTIFTANTKDGPDNLTVGFSVQQNISLTTNLIKIEVNDTGKGLYNNPDYLGYVNITNLAVGTVTELYNTTGAIGGNPDPQASLLVKTVVVQHNNLLPPVITLHENKNITYVVGMTGNFLNFSIYDDNPDYYTINRNNVMLFSGGWENDANITFNIDGLGVGLSNYSIIAYDTYSAYTVSVIWVNVTNPSGTGSISGTGSSSNSVTDGRSNRTIGANFAGPEYILLGLAVVSIVVLKKKRKLS